MVICQTDDSAICGESLVMMNAFLVAIVATTSAESSDNCDNSSKDTKSNTSSGSSGSSGSRRIYAEGDRGLKMTTSLVNDGNSELIDCFLYRCSRSKGST